MLLIIIILIFYFINYNIMKFIIQYKNQYIKVKANEKYFHIGKIL